MQTRTEEANAYKLQDQMIFQIDHSFIFHSVLDDSKVNEMLYRLHKLPNTLAYTMLLIRNEYGYSYAQVLAQVNNSEVISNYLLLLKKFIECESISDKEVLVLLKAKDRNNQCLGRKGNATNQLEYLKLVMPLRMSGKNEEIMDLLMGADNSKLTFIDDIISHFLPRTSPTEKLAYINLLCFMLEYKLIPSHFFPALAASREGIANCLIKYAATLPDEEKINVLKSALNENRDLGKLFWFNVGARESLSISLIRKALQEAEPFAEDLSDYEISSSSGRGSATKKNWLAGFFKRKQAKEILIPMQEINAERSTKLN